MANSKERIYEKGFIRTDSGEFIDKANDVTSVLHADFEGGAYGDGIRDDTLAFLKAEEYAVSEGLPLQLGAAMVHSITQSMTIRRLHVNRGVLKPASGVTVTIEGLTEPVGPFQWIDLSDGGSVEFATGAVERYLPQWWGAVGDGVADDTAAIEAWYAAIPDGGTGLVPIGAFRFTSALSWNRNVNVVGVGPGSCFVPDVGAAADAITVNDTAASHLYRIKLFDFSILSDEDECCLNALVLERVHVSEVNVHVKAKAEEYGTVLKGCLINRIRIVTSVNFNYPYPAAMPVVGAVKAERDDTGVAVNANEMDMVIEGGAKGLHIADQGGEGNNKVSGTIEGLSGVPLYAEDCTSLVVRDIHLEANAAAAHFEQCTNLRLGSGLFCDHDVDLVGCVGARIESGAVIDGVSIDANCRNTTLEAFKYNVTGSGVLSDLSATTIFEGAPMNALTDANRARAVGAGAAPTHNGFGNGQLTAWTGSTPDDWAFLGTAPTWTHTGDGQADTRKHWSPDAAMVTVAGTQHAAIPINWAYVGETVVAYAWVYVPTGEPNLTMSLWFDGGATVVSLASTTVKDRWVLLAASVYLNPAMSSGVIAFQLAADGDFYIADAGYGPGMTAPRGLLPVM